MNLLQAFRMAIKSVVTNKVRSFLTMLGVIIGVASVITAVAFAQGSTKSITDSIRSLGTDQITVNITNRGSNRVVRYEDLTRLQDSNPDLIAMTAPFASGSATAKSLDINANKQIVATTPAYTTINSIDVQNGRFILDLDVELRNKVAVIGSAIAEEFFPSQDPLGSYIKLNGSKFRVVGILEETSAGRAGSNDDRIIVPVSTGQRLLKIQNINSFTVLAADSSQVSAAIDAISEYLTDALKNPDGFRIQNAEQALSTLDSITGTLMMVLGGIASISLVVGGIGIMNIMLVSVTERTREIGVRKAIGAKRRSILTQFLIEAVILTGIGGLIGVGAAFAAIKYIIGGLNIVPPVYSLPWTGLAFGISLVTGVIFGIFPAWKAASLNPIEALRTQ